MQDKSEILSALIEVFNSKDILKNIEPDMDFFDLGASSLTVVDLQIQFEQLIEKACEQPKVVETAKLMANPTLNGWAGLYAEA